MPRPKGIPKTGGRVKGSVNKAVRKVRERLLRREELTAAATIEAIRRGMTYDVRRLHDEHGDLKPLTELTEEEAWCIAGFELEGPEALDLNVPEDWERAEAIARGLSVLDG